MNVKDALKNRRSVRAFTDEPITKAELTEILRLAVRAVSRTNIQPWEFAVVSGDALKRLGQANIDELKRNALPPESYVLDDVYRSRKIDIAKRLFKEMDISRDNKEKRDWWSQRGFRYFDAPAAIIVYTGEVKNLAATKLDIGCLTQNICTAAMEFGLGTCVEWQGVALPEVLHKELGIPGEKEFVIAIAIGHPDDSFPANSVISPREDVESITKWYGFE